MLKYEVWCDNCNELVGRINVEAFQVNKLNDRIDYFEERGCFNCNDLKIHVKRILIPGQYTFNF